MPIPVITQNPGVVWDEVYTLPLPDDSAVFPLSMASNQNGRFHSRGQVRVNSQTAGQYWAGSFRSIAGGVTTLEGGQQFYLSILGAGGAQWGQFPASIMSAWPDTGSGADIADGAEMGDFFKVWWMRWLMRSPTAAPGNHNGVCVYPINNKNDLGWPTEAVGVRNHGGFGFFGDGAGQWAYQSYDRTGISLLRETVALPAHTLTEWNMCELVLINARPGIPATLEIYFNGVFVGNRNWTGALLEDYAANEWHWLPVLGGGLSAETQFKQIVCRKGAFTRSGVAV